ncbi:hypothetical protein GQR58_023955 [Nymphon striatum]|nr:hypothetical protein GQR58_023955 [Nymphon striatum]
MAPPTTTKSVSSVTKMTVADETDLVVVGGGAIYLKEFLSFDLLTGENILSSYEAEQPEVLLTDITEEPDPMLKPGMAHASSQCEEPPGMAHASSQCEEPPGMVHASTQYEELPSVDASTQYKKQPHTTRSVRCQANLGKKVYRSKGNQTKPSTASVGVECQILKPHISLPEPDESDESESDGDVQEDMDMYDPEEDEELFESDDFNFTSGSYVEEDKFIVFKSSLWELFATCPRCTEPCLVEEKTRIGTKVVIRQKCPDAKCGFHRDWSSQPSYTHNQGRIPAGNLQLSGAILFTGASPIKILRVLKSMNIASISPSTFNNHQTKFLVPTVMHTWQKEQEKYFKKLREMDGGLVLGCDGRADSPGHSAKYGSYTVLEERINKIIDQQLVQSNEVANSGQMEKEGLIRAASKLQDAGLPIDVIVTDRHPQIQKWLRMSLKDTTHYFDVWHVSKGLTKKLEMLARKPGCEPLREWITSISNHLHWCANTPDPEVKLAQWLSIINHMHNIHEGHGDIFPKCTHAYMNDSHRKKKWLNPYVIICFEIIFTAWHLLFIFSIFILQGAHTPSSLGHQVTKWGSRFSRQPSDHETGSTGLHGTSSRWDLT